LERSPGERTSTGTETLKRELLIGKKRVVLATKKKNEAKDGSRGRAWRTGGIDPPEGGLGK